MTGKSLISNQYIRDIADAIRSKKGTTDTIKTYELADEISTISGDVDTELSISSNKVRTTGAVTLTSELTGSDYVGVSDVNLNGHLENATVKFYRMIGQSPNPSVDTLLNSSITNSNGIAVANVTISETSNIYAHFDGMISKYPNATSNTVTVELFIPLFQDDCSTSDTLINYASSISLRNNGTSVINHPVNTDYHLITCTGGGVESFIPIPSLTGQSNFTMEYDSYIEGSNGSSGFIIYKDSNNWTKLTDDGNNKYWKGYKINGTFGEQGYTNVGYTIKEWIHNKFTLNDYIFTVELSRNGTVFFTISYEINHSLLDDTTVFGLDSEWLINTKTRYKNILVEQI